MFYLVGLIHEVLRWVEVEGELAESAAAGVVVLEVVPGLEVRDVERVADAGDVRPEQRLRRAEQGQDAVLNLTAHLSWREQLMHRASQDQDRTTAFLAPILMQLPQVKENFLYAVLLGQIAKYLETLTCLIQLIRKYYLSINGR